MSLPPVLRLIGAVRHYAWGSRTVLADLQGRDGPTERPEAELWLGDHPTAPADVIMDGRRLPLDVAIAADPPAWLGSSSGLHGLPFLLKVLAIERPLSLQVHPDDEQAARGHAAEQARGVPRDAPERRYPDPVAKPELLHALTTVDALCGFRSVEATLEVLARLDVPAMAETRRRLNEGGATALTAVVGALLRTPDAERAALVGAIAQAWARVEARDADAGQAGGGMTFRDLAGWIGQLARLHPEDPGVAVALLLEPRRLAPGDALALRPRVPHAYLRGTGVEIMARSDNVLRGGLTDKHVDVDELLTVLDPAAAVDHRPVERGVGALRVWETATPAFELAHAELAGDEVELPEGGVQVLLATDGEVTVTADGEARTLRRGEAAIVPASTGRVTLRGSGHVFRAAQG